MGFRLLIFVFILSGCAGITPPEDYKYKELDGEFFTLASWQKITSPTDVFKVYIEGDGNAFDSRGYPTSDPTPKGTILREIAFKDSSKNVVYLARPCQFVEDMRCTERDWTTGRFSKKALYATCKVIKEIGNDNQVILIGFSGGAMLAGLTSIHCPQINTKKVITISGNLDHKTWTEDGEMTPLYDSLNLADYKAEFAKVPQTHYIGTKDEVIPMYISKKVIANHNNIISVKGASHSRGYEKIYNKIWNEK